jgi:predicted ATPase/class 3 adenylate cyclase
MANQPTLDAYIPIDRRLAIISGQDLPDRMQGAALFADISGFTPLTETLARELGLRRGAEEVTRQLNLVYASLISLVDRYHGSVIGFSGDALTCWFDGDRGLRAVTCALSMQESMQAFSNSRSPSGLTFPLGIKIAVTSGSVRRFRVGDPGIQLIDVLAGTLLDRLAAGEHLAGTGEIIVSGEVASALKDNLQIAGWRRHADTGEQFALIVGMSVMAPVNPWQAIKPGNLPEEQIRPWVLSEICNSYKTGQGQFISELRPATALFLGFSGIDYDRDEEAEEKLDAYIHWVQQIIVRYEGFLIQLTFGDKGSYLYCVFGAPVAHDDDPARAVAAALELCSPPDFIAAQSIRIGISQGIIRAGPYGGPTRCTYGAMGDEVNLSARLMGQAKPGQILVSQRIVNAVSDTYQYQAIGPVHVKGKDLPVLVSQVIARKQADPNLHHRFTNTLVGREAELRIIDQVLETVECGKGQVLRIDGYVGIGKSRLATELIDRANARHFQTAAGGCYSTTLNVAYAPWRQVFCRLLRLEAAQDSENCLPEAYSRQVKTVEEFIQQANPDWMLRLPLLGDLLGLPIPDNPTTAAFEPKLRRSALFDLLSEIIQYLSQKQPILILLDDLHWMDEASCSLTLAAGRAISQLPILLTLLHRTPPPETSILPELDDLSYHQKLSLGELPIEGTAALLTNRLGGRPAGLALSLIQVETEGNPFFVEELANILIESSNLRKNPNGEWVLSDDMVQALQRSGCLQLSSQGWALLPGADISAVDLGLPESVQGAILARFDRLPESSKLTLKVASVVGRIFPLSIVAGAHPLKLNNIALQDEFKLLIERDFIRRESTAEQVYAFRHALTQDVAYETLLYEQRRQLHQAVAETIEQLTPDAIDPLAHHSFLGEDWLRAFRYQTAAGNQAQKLFANQEGIEHYRKALQSAGHLVGEEFTAREQQVYACLGELLAVTGQYDPARDQLSQALALARILNDLDAQAKACRWIAYVYEFCSDYPQALEWIEKGLKLLEARETASTAELMAIAGLIYVRQGNYDRALQLCENGIRIAENLGEATSLAFSHNSRAIVSYSRGDMLEAVAHFQQAAELYQKAGNIHGQALSYNGMGNAYQNLGKWPEAYIYLRRSAEIFNQTGDELHKGFANNNLGEIARNQGRLDEALDYYQQALHTMERLGSSAYVFGVLHMNLGATYVRRKEIGMARQHLETSRLYYEQAGSRDFLPELYRHRSEAALIAGEFELAKADGDSSLRHARELSMRSEEGMALRVLGEVALAKYEFSEAERCLSDSISILNEVKHEYEAARSQLSLAQVYLSQGRQNQGGEQLDQCVLVFERLGAFLELESEKELKTRRFKNSSTRRKSFS